jgi:drug/metabolite transporter (DMT)-like permease
MPLSLVLLVLLSALAHASWNAILKRCREPEHAVVSMMALAAACGTLVALVLRVPASPVKSVAWSLASGLLEAGYFVTLARALSRAPLGSVYTIVRGGALVVVWPISITLLGERITLGRVCGTLLVVLGLAATGMSDRKPRQKATARKTASGIAVAALCALFVGGYHLAYKLALSSGGRPEAVVSISLASAVLLNLAMIGSGRRLALAAFRAQPVRIAIGGFLASVGFLVFLSAMKDAGAGVVLTLRNTSILFAQALGFALGERPRRLSVFGAVLVTAGAAFLAR